MKSCSIRYEEVLGWETGTGIDEDDELLYIHVESGPPHVCRVSFPWD
jgi:hypothetical protein